MGQAKPLGSCWVIVDLILLKNRNFVRQKHNYLELQKRDKILIFFKKDWYTNCLRWPNCSEIFELQKYSKYPDCYRLFCFWQILFSLRCVLVLMILWFPNFRNFVSYKSVRSFQIATDCSFCLTESLFVALCAYFDESVGCIGGMSHRKVGI